MSVTDVANSLVDLCRQGKFMDAINNHYSDNIVSVEPVGSEAMPAEMSGIDAIRGKNQWWTDNHEVHGLTLDGPFIGDGQFAVRFTIDATPKMTGQRTTMIEVGIYTVENDKITKEEFYYNAP